MPNSGKSTLFKALTKKEVNIANYPFATVDPNVGVVRVPDNRLSKLGELSDSKEVTPTAIEFVDIAGLVKGANKGEGLGNQFLSHIREMDAIAYVVRAFHSENIQHIEKNINPAEDLEIVKSELALKDLETVERRIDKKEGEARTGDKDAEKELNILLEFRRVLNEGNSIYDKIEGDENTNKLLKELQLLTAKPYFYIANLKEGREVDTSNISANEEQIVAIDALKAVEVSELTREDREELGVKETALEKVIRTGYGILDLITFFTTGEKETRAWTVKKGSTAPEAAGVIHSDFQNKFIRAEVIQSNTLLELAGWSIARESGKIRTEGKEYIMRDGDVCHFLHS